MSSPVDPLGAGGGEGWQPYGALYLHLPFCKRRCRYCDFATEALATDDPRVDSYIEDLVLQVRRAGRAGLLGAVKTVYLGGGTPSHAGSARLSMLLYTLSLSMHLTPQVECTMEANPESLSPNLVRDLWALGVNRLSLGVQSFDDAVLATLGRIHDAARAREAVAMAQERFENVSIDLMCGIPGQTRESFAADVHAAVDLGVPHVSIYPLTVEEGTPFERMVESGELDEPDPDLQAEMMREAARILGAAGLHRYEVASYARPGFESRHNRAYWTGVPYLGLGSSAVTMRQRPGCRQRVRDGRLEEELDARQMAAEDLMLAMRMSCGVSCGQVDSAASTLPEAPRAFAELEQQGLVEMRGGSYRPTEAGWLLGNRLYGRLLELAP